MKITDIGDTAALERALLHEAPHIRTKARAVASGWPLEMQRWLEAEGARSLEDRAIVPGALLSLMTDVLASLLASIGVAGADAETTGRMVEAFRKELPRRVDIIREHLAERGRA